MPNSVLEIINIASAGKGVAVETGEFGQFDFGLDDFGGGAQFADGSTYIVINNNSQQYQVSSAG